MFGLYLQLVIYLFQHSSPLDAYTKVLTQIVDSFLMANLSHITLNIRDINDIYTNAAQVSNDRPINVIVGHQ